MPYKSRREFFIALTLMKNLNNEALLNLFVSMQQVNLARLKFVWPRTIIEYPEVFYINQEVSAAAGNSDLLAKFKAKMERANLDFALHAIYYWRERSIFLEYKSHLSDALTAVLNEVDQKKIDLSHLHFVAEMVRDAEELLHQPLPASKPDRIRLIDSGFVLREKFNSVRKTVAEHVSRSERDIAPRLIYPVGAFDHELRSRQHSLAHAEAFYTDSDAMQAVSFSYEFSLQVRTRPVVDTQEIALAEASKELHEACYELHNIGEAVTKELAGLKQGNDQLVGLKESLASARLVQQGLRHPTYGQGSEESVLAKIAENEANTLRLAIKLAVYAKPLAELRLRAVTALHSVTTAIGSRPINYDTVMNVEQEQFSQLPLAMYRCVAADQLLRLTGADLATLAQVIVPVSDNCEVKTTLMSLGALSEIFRPR